MARVDEYYFKEGCFIEEWHNHRDDPDCSVARVRVEPLKTTKLHKLENTVERYVILDGSASVTVGKKSWVVGSGDVIVIEANQTQKIENLLETDLVFLAICSPRFEPKNYKECSDN